jgi:hypothetical protein
MIFRVLCYRVVYKLNISELYEKLSMAASFDGKTRIRYRTILLKGTGYYLRAHIIYFVLKASQPA